MSKNDFKMEYRIVIQKGRAKPYTLWTFNTYEACYFKLIELIQDHNSKVQKEYYVTNEDFENEYPAFLADITKYTIQCRSVEEWEEYRETRVHKNKSNVLMFRKSV